MRRTSPLALLSILAAAAAFGQPSNHPLAIAALESLDRTREEMWSYTKTTIDNDETRVEHHDGAKPEGARWTLVAIDGRAPTEKERRSYARDKAKELEQRKKGGDDDEEIDHSTIRLVSQDGEKAVFEFRTNGGGMFGKAVKDHVIGTIVAVKDGQWAERFELATRDGAMRPIPGVRVDAFRLVMTFDRDPESGDVLPRRIESHVRGRAFGMKSLDSDTVVRYTDYRRVR